jgi:hypothetical protein
LFFSCGSASDGSGGRGSSERCSSNVAEPPVFAPCLDRCDPSTQRIEQDHDCDPDLERELGEAKFIRIHRSIIVNLDRVHGLELQSSGEYEVVLKSKVRLRLSRRFRKRLEERMDAMSASD